MILRHAWLPLGITLAVIGVLAGSGPLLAVAVFLLLAGRLAQFWAEHSLDRVELERLLPENRAFPGETLRLTYRVTNRKALPLPRLEVSDQVPEGLVAPREKLPARAYRTRTYSHSTHLGGHERVSWSLDLSCSERGYYRIGTARLTSGDGFGLLTNTRNDETTAHVTVFPQTLSLIDLGLPAARPLGERKGGQRIFEDPLRIAGVRDYQPGDPIGRIDWKATARRRQLQSRVYEPSTTRHLILALNADTVERTWQGYVPELLEGAIVVAASLAVWAHEQRYAVGLLTNGSLPGSDRTVRIAPGRSPEQLPRILEALGGIGVMTAAPLAAQLEQQGHSLPLGSTVIVITAIMPDELAATLHRLHSRGHPVTVLSVAEEDWPDQLGEIPVKRVDTTELFLQGAAAAAGGSRAP